MNQDISRRAIVGGLGVAAGGLAANQAVAGMPAKGTQMTVDGIVAWCHPQRRLLSFKSVPPGRDGMLLRLKGDAGDQSRLKSVRPGMPATVRVAWRPDLDILSPWAPLDVTCGNGEYFAARLEFDQSVTKRKQTA